MYIGRRPSWYFPPKTAPPSQPYLGTKYLLVPLVPWGNVNRINVALPEEFTVSAPDPGVMANSIISAVCNHNQTPMT